MAKKRRIFTREFKVQAVKLVTEKGYSVAEAARNWSRAAKSSAASIPSPN
jgi:transposase-like protein